MEQINITLARYNYFEGEISSIFVVADDVEMSVPLDPANRQYAEIMRQVEAGELTIQDAD